MNILIPFLVIVAAVLITYMICRLLKVDVDTRNVIYVLIIIMGVIWIIKGGV
jgi:hypothetical protein